MNISENLEMIRNEIRNVSSHPVTILGACKKQPLGRVQEAIDGGLKHLGNNYLQEGEALREKVHASGIQWHFIGKIQSRKAKSLIQYDLIHSLDRIKVAEALEKHLSGRQRRIRALVQINIGEEASKSGILASELESFLVELDKFPSILCKGLMVFPPPLQPIEKRAPFYIKAKELFDSYAESRKWDTLSMGTSDDYLLAVSHGSNLIRLGSVLFGERS